MPSEVKVSRPTERPPNVNFTAGTDGSRYGEFNPLENPDWDTILSNCSNASFFFTSAWARVLCESYSFRPRYLVFPSGVPYVFPWMEIRSLLTGTRGVSLPFTDSCSLEGVSPSAFSCALTEVLRQGTNRRWKYWELRGGAEILPEIPPSTEFLTHRLQLDHTEARMFSRFCSTARTAARKAEGAGIQVEISREMAAVKIFYDLLCRTRKRHGSPPQPFLFFENLHRHILEKKLGFIALARRGDVPAAGIFFLHRGKEAIYKFAASDERLQHLRAGNLALWRGIQYLIQRGAERLDFGRTSLSNTGLQRFKRAWGTEEKRLGYIRYDFRAKDYTTFDDESTRWHTLVFRHVSPVVGKLISRFLYRHAA
jgi:hypothetical protein